MSRTGGEKSSEHREDGHDPPPGCAGATALASARDCRSCARGGAGASSLGLRSDRGGGGPQLLATERKEASTTALFGTMSTSRIKLMMDVKDSSKSSSSMKNGSIPVRGRRGGFPVIRHMLHKGACHAVRFPRVPMHAHVSTRSTHARGGSEACSALAAPLTLLAQNPGIESSSRASLFEHVAHAGVVGCHRVELAETAAARLARPAVVEGAGWGRWVLSRVHS